MKEGDRTFLDIFQNTVDDLRDILRVGEEVMRDITEDERYNLIECIHSLTEMYLRYRDKYEN